MNIRRLSKVVGQVLAVFLVSVGELHPNGLGVWAAFSAGNFSSLLTFLWDSIGVMQPENRPPGNSGMYIFMEWLLSPPPEQISDGRLWRRKNSRVFLRRISIMFLLLPHPPPPPPKSRSRTKHYMLKLVICSFFKTIPTKNAKLILLKS